MAKYLHKNTHNYDTIDPKRTLKMSSKVLQAAVWVARTFQVRHARLRPEATMRNQFYLKWNKNVLILETIEITHF